MIAGTAHSVSRRILVTLLLTGLALVPAWSLADRGQQTKDKEEQAARGRQGRAQEPVVARPQPPRQERGGPQVRSEPIVPRAPEPQRAAPSPQVWRPQERPSVSDWRGREQPAPRSNPYLSYRQPSREVSVPETPGFSARDRERPQQQDLYQLYRTPRRVTTPQPSPRAPAESSRWAPAREQKERPKAGQLSRAPRRVTTPEAGFGDRSGRLKGDQGQVTEPKGVARGEQSRTREKVRERERQAPQREVMPTPRQERGRPQVRPDLPAREPRRFAVPEASFRGPGADESVRSVPAQERQRVRERLQERAREHNRQWGQPGLTRPTRDVVGNPVPKQTPLLVRDTISRLSVGYQHLRVTHGAPGFGYLVTPRRISDYWEGYWDGYADGWWAGHHYHHHPSLVVYFWYPFYFSDPYWFAFYYEGYYPSIYHYFGWCPGWIYPHRVYYHPVEYIYVPVTPYRYYYSGYHLDYAGATQAIRDIRRAWLDSDIELLARHLTDQLDIQVYFDGEYSYTTETSDFYEMSLDTLATTQTVAMDLKDPIWLSSREVFYTGRQVFYDPEGDRQVVYVSFRLRQLGSEWYLVAVGTSLDPIEHQYTDFRYQY